MQVYDRGLLRRLPPMLDGDPRRVRMVYSLLFSLPGTPMLFYGEEIGMGEDLVGGQPARRPDADAVDVGPNGGFSRARAPQAARAGGDRWVRAGVRQRRRPAQRPGLPAVVLPAADLAPEECPELGWGGFEVLEQPHAPRCWRTCARGTTAHWSPCTTWAPSRCGCRCSWPTADPRTGWPTCWWTGTTRVDDEGRAELALEGYGYRWLRVVAPGTRRLL